MGVPSHWRYGVLFVVLAVHGGGCRFDANDRCGTDQIFDDVSEGCACRAGLVPTLNGCKPCGANEEIKNYACVCKDGFEKNSTGACVVPPPPRPKGFGDACASGGPACPSATYPLCQPTNEPAVGYCTKRGCTTSDDCGFGFTCTVWEAMPYCRRAPAGQGNACKASDDCKSFDATYCETFMSHKCLVQGCMVTPNTCPDGWECCDLTPLPVPTFCVPKGECPKK